MALPLPISTRQVRMELGQKGFDGWLEAIGGEAEQEEAFEEAIAEATSEFESDCDIYVIQRVVLSKPLDAGKARIAKDGNGNYVGDYDVAEDQLDLFIEDWRRFAQVKTWKRPIVNIAKLQLRYGSTTAGAVVVIDIPQDWIAYDHLTGVISIIPTVGASASATGTSYLMLIPTFGMMQSARVHGTFPKLVRLDYTVGYLPKTFDPDNDNASDASPDSDVRQVLKGIRLKAAADILGRVRRRRGAGGGSISREGLSQSYPAVKFEEEIQRYEMEVQRIKDRLNYRQGAFVAEAI